jgi:predicted nucleic acid-binding protein
VLREDLVLAEASPASHRRAARLMERYADRPMDLADATLVVLADERGLSRVFTLEFCHRHRRLGQLSVETTREPRLGAFRPDCAL